MSAARPGSRYRTLPAAPAIEEIRRRGGLARLLGRGFKARRDGRRWLRVHQRMRRDGVVTLAMAEKISFELLHVHPAELWPDEWASL